MVNFQIDGLIKFDYLTINPNKFPKIKTLANTVLIKFIFKVYVIDSDHLICGQKKIMHIKQILIYNFFYDGI